jgi:hypothetical protein
VSFGEVSGKGMLTPRERSLAKRKVKGGRGVGLKIGQTGALPGSTRTVRLGYLCFQASESLNNLDNLPARKKIGDSLRIQPARRNRKAFCRTAGLADINEHLNVGGAYRP